MILSAYRTKREIAATLLRDAIIRGELTPGTRLLLERRSRNGKDEVDRTSWGWLAQET